MCARNKEEADESGGELERRSWALRVRGGDEGESGGEEEVGKLECEERDEGEEWP